jgi:hypothetical protein
MHITSGMKVRAVAAVTLAAGLAVSGAAGPASAGADQGRYEGPATVARWYFDDDVNGVVFLNMDRDAECTEEYVAWEQAMVEWYEAGNEGEFPVAPPEDSPSGVDMVTWHDVMLPNVHDRDVLLEQSMAEGVHAELWTFHDGIQSPDDLRTPCLDTQGGERVATGTGGWRLVDNDVFGSGSRGNAWTWTHYATLTGSDGSTWEYRDVTRGVRTGTGELVQDRSTEDPIQH